mmetsp:Transcript_28167/g.36423  ORF Transcript_28167/g.36423 Transcript_28167/m.36423 type:complete len:325 (-) Transcript_28167:298-1272(-)
MKVFPKILSLLFVVQQTSGFLSDISGRSTCRFGFDQLIFDKSSKKLVHNPARVKITGSAGSEVDYPTWLSRQIELKTRPEPIKIPRSRIVKDFAVLLMRSSYAVADDLDFVPMDQFQKLFFLYRQSEYEEYVKQNPGVLQGDLADPKYFDFISFAQYHTISEAMKNGQQVFIEKCGAEGEEQTVRRDPQFANNALLPVEHSSRVGDRILAFLNEQYPTVNIETNFRPSLDGIVTSIAQIMGLFKLNFFMLDYSVTPKSGKQIEVKLTLPATLWSQQVLKSQNTVLRNDFEAKAIISYLKSCGVSASYSTSYTKTDITHLFQLRS